MTLRELRLQNEKTAAEVATVLGVTDSAVSNYEHGRRSIDLEQVLKLSNLYNCSAEEVIDAQLKSIRESDKVI